jgi:hypothetical protein
MEIKLELENSDIDCFFEPDFRVQSNTSDETQVSWRLSNDKSQGNVAFLFPELSTESTLCAIGPGWDDVRLLCR